MSSGGEAASGIVGATAEGADAARGATPGTTSPLAVEAVPLATGGSAVCGPGSRRLHAARRMAGHAIERALHTVVRD